MLEAMLANEVRPYRHLSKHLRKPSPLPTSRNWDMRIYIALLRRYTLHCGGGVIPYKISVPQCPVDYIHGAVGNIIIEYSSTAVEYSTCFPSCWTGFS